MKKCYRVWYKISCISCLNRTTKEMFWTYCKCPLLILIKICVKLWTQKILCEQSKWTTDWFWVTLDVKKKVIGLLFRIIMYGELQWRLKVLGLLTWYNWNRILPPLPPPLQTIPRRNDCLVLPTFQHCWIVGGGGVEILCTHLNWQKVLFCNIFWYKICFQLL